MGESQSLFFSYRDSQFIQNCAALIHVLNSAS